MRWGLVARIIRALCRRGVWGPDARRGPMHEHYKDGLFDTPWLLDGRGAPGESDVTEGFREAERDAEVLRGWYGEELLTPSSEGVEGLRRVGLDVRGDGEVGCRGRRGLTLGRRWWTSRCLDGGWVWRLCPSDRGSARGGRPRSRGMPRSQARAFVSRMRRRRLIFSWRSLTL